MLATIISIVLVKKANSKLILTNILSKYAYRNLLIFNKYMSPYLQCFSVNDMIQKT